MSNNTKNPTWNGLSENNIRFIKFLVEKTQNVKCPMSITKACRDFQTATDKTETIRNLNARFLNIRQKICTLEALDLESRVKLMFAFRVPINDDFLAEISKEADVTLDECNRLTKYEAKIGGGLKLKGSHFQMLEFLAEKSKYATAPLIIIETASAYKKATEDYRSVDTLRKAFNDIKGSIFTADEYSLELRVRMLFASGARLFGDVLKDWSENIDYERNYDRSREGPDYKLQKTATVKVDEEARIIEYVANDGSLTLSGKHYTPHRRSSFAMDSGRSKRSHEDSDEDEIDAKRPRDDETLSDDDVVYDGPGVPSQPIQLKTEPVDDHEDGFIQREIKAEDMEHPTDMVDDMPAGNQTNETSDVSSKKVLEFLRNLVSTLDCGALKGLERKIGQALGNPEIQTQTIPTEVLVGGLQSNLYTVQRRATVAESADSTSLEKFLLILSSSLFYFGTPSLNSLHESLKETIRSLKGRDMRISEEVICRAIESLFMLVHD